MKDRSLAARLQSAASTQFAGLRAAGRVCTNTSGDAGMKKASTRLLEQETQTPSPAPDLIPAESSTENLHWDWYSKRGHFNCLPHPISRDQNSRSGQDHQVWLLSSIRKWLAGQHHEFHRQVQLPSKNRVALTQEAHSDRERRWPGS